MAAVSGLSFETYLDAVSEDVERIVSAAPALLERSVPSCPEWTGSSLLVHLAWLYEVMHAQVRAGDAGAFTPAVAADGANGEVVGGPDPKVLIREPDSDPVGHLDALEERWHELLLVLHEVGPTAPCWNFSGADLDTSWAARRMAHETSLHRVDLELTGGRAGSVERELAVDGIAEVLEVVLPRAFVRAREAGVVLGDQQAPGDRQSPVDRHPAGVGTAALGGSLCLVASDVDTAFMIEVQAGRLRWRAGRGPADAVVVAPASDLLLLCWNRIAPERLAVTGDAAVARAWANLPAV